MSPKAQPLKIHTAMKMATSSGVWKEASSDTELE
jgi:hypothetical protein